MTTGNCRKACPSAFCSPFGTQAFQDLSNSWLRRHVPAGFGEEDWLFAADKPCPVEFPNHAEYDQCRRNRDLNVILGFYWSKRCYLTTCQSTCSFPFHQIPWSSSHVFLVMTMPRRFLQCSWSWIRVRSRTSTPLIRTEAIENLFNHSTGR